MHLCTFNILDYLTGFNVNSCLLNIVEPLLFKLILHVLLVSFELILSVKLYAHFSFARTFVDIWYSLSESIVACDSSHGFKNKIHKFLYGRGFYLSFAKLPFFINTILYSSPIRWNYPLSLSVTFINKSCLKSDECCLRSLSTGQPCECAFTVL